MIQSESSPNANNATLPLLPSRHPSPISATPSPTSYLPSSPSPASSPPHPLPHHQSFPSSSSSKSPSNRHYSSHHHFSKSVSSLQSHTFRLSFVVCWHHLWYHGGPCARRGRRFLRRGRRRRGRLRWWLWGQSRLVVLLSGKVSILQGRFGRVSGNDEGMTYFFSTP